ncbi:hypothetical protein MCBMB27_00914 [Methylobacterium phyllosphaerae]|uniref:Uncharacterized protein n=2 Tax=Methylobacterium TaxID=407 RepID=A0AAE8L9V5_9HYPH|nr:MULTISPECIES: hypothetical protein [Methylobacterium]AGO88459.1 protein of unassigned function [Methylobacterium oryzae CBMB20]AIQ89333.1 protein of unassigned function [Methylobacterium oryzae CBMB20]APT30205.1 hypothetical protein MCBMB27_00914 [Methylobacterium phyllosphaerae]SFH76144.1 hypothetical protein SAMN05192567_1582 [Methylobacterium phyllosphaerae]
MHTAESARLTLAIELVLPIDLLLGCLHELFPHLAWLPLGGSHLAQLALIIIPTIAVVELFHCGRRCYQAIRAWWRTGDGT